MRRRTRFVVLNKRQRMAHSIWQEGLSPPEAESRWLADVANAAVYREELDGGLCLAVRRPDEIEFSDSISKKRRLQDHVAVTDAEVDAYTHDLQKPAAKVGDQAFAQFSQPFRMRSAGGHPSDDLSAQANIVSGATQHGPSPSSHAPVAPATPGPVAAAGDATAPAAPAPATPGPVAAARAANSPAA